LNLLMSFGSDAFRTESPLRALARRLSQLAKKEFHAAASAPAAAHAVGRGGVCITHGSRAARAV
jgi:hypothetical protein